MKEKLMQKIKKKEILVGVVQTEKVDMVNRGENYIGDVVDSDLAKLVQTGMLKATNNFDFIKDVNFIAICVPTPLDAHQQPDISYVKSSAESVAGHLQKGSLVVLESTTYPGTTRDLLQPILEKGSGLKCGVGSIGKDATEVAAAMYRTVLEGDVMEVSSPEVAEMEKILENTYRNVNIALVNELAMLCQKMEINIWEVIDAAKTKPYGFQAFYPGPGLGGHCIPLDPYYLSWKAREYGFHTSMIESAMMINDRMPEYCVERAEKILNRSCKALNGSKILVLGVAYKQDIDDYRESPAIRVIRELEKSSAKVDYFDPWIPKYKDHGEWRSGLEELNGQIIEGYDLVMITTAHSNVDYGMVQRHAKAIFDTKNVMKNIGQRENINVL